MRGPVGIPPQDAPVPPPEPADRPDLFIVEAGASPERRCAECGKRTSRWKPVRRTDKSSILCEDCAAKAAMSADEGGCPSCGAPLRPGDTFCGKCGARIEYACPTCGASVESEDAFCGKCGTRLV